MSHGAQNGDPKLACLSCAPVDLELTATLFNVVFTQHQQVLMGRAQDAANERIIYSLTSVGLILSYGGEQPVAGDPTTRSEDY